MINKKPTKYQMEWLRAMAERGQCLLHYDEGRPRSTFWHLTPGNVISTVSVNNALKHKWIEREIIWSLHGLGECGATITDLGHKVIEA